VAPSILFEKSTKTDVVFDDSSGINAGERQTAVLKSTLMPLVRMFPNLHTTEAPVYQLQNL
jgi:hypothetical protein